MPSEPTLRWESASTLAVIASSRQPLLFLSGDLKIIAASASFCRAFQIEPASVPGRGLAQLGNGEWAMPKLASLLKATASGQAAVEAYEIDLVRQGQKLRNLLVNAHKLDDGDHERIRLLVAVTDVTFAREQAREKDALIREKEILLQEVQHRVANSLQIIASLLMQSARKVQSEEARGHLRDAHHRVMSIAALQRHLAASTAQDVSLRPYFAQLCESLASSTIYDHKRLSIAVTVDDSVVKANISVSLGLMLTELVINALKHAFPDSRNGKIVIDYRSNGENWTMSVNDDGIGMPAGEEKARPGLGTGIVKALAGQIQAVVRVVDAKPGASVTISHDEAVAGELPAAA
jgi:two-component sensor histidine kinase